MTITATEAKNNFGKYLIMSNYEDIFITKNGRVVSKLTAPTVNMDEILDSLVGVIPAEFTDIDIKEERLSAK